LGADTTSHGWKDSSEAFVVLATLGREPVVQRHFDELGEHEGLCQRSVMRRDVLEVEQAFATLEEQLDLPTNSVDLEEFLVAEQLLRDGREDGDVAGKAQAYRETVFCFLEARFFSFSRARATLSSGSGTTNSLAASSLPW
jgi:hypothetical protein